jgi:flagellar P-ring protein precursor FlgI
VNALTPTLVSLFLLAAQAEPAAGGQAVPQAPAGPQAPVDSSAPVRVKDVADLQGARPIPLVGYGLVIGLNKTGDRRQTVFSAQSLANALERFGVVVQAEQIKVENVAGVMVTAELPPFVRPGARLDVTVSSIGDARSLQGGTLLVTGLRGPDGAIYALSQGPLTLGGFGGGSGGNAVQVNHLTVGRIPGGALVQTGQRAELGASSSILLSVRQPDFSTAQRLAQTINAELGPDAAKALDSASVGVQVPAQYQGALSDLMARLEPLTLRVDTPARVVINERTGTVVVGGAVRIGAAAVAHGNLSVRVSTTFQVSQPTPFSSGGQTVVVPDQQVDVSEGTAQLVTLEEGTTLAAVVQALNALGVTPRDIIAIMQALRAAGALRAEIVII